MKKTTLIFIVISSVLFSYSCTNGKKKGAGYMQSAVLYQQKAAESRALYYQAFNMAALMLDKDLANDSIKQKRALVFDIDETVLDNSPYQAKCVLEGITYPDKWNEWCNMAKAKALPGAVAFINDAFKNGVAIFYITNRTEEVHEATKKNLLAEGLPLPDDSFLMMKAKESSKESRRQQVLKDYHIALLFGDNLADFTADFDNKTTAVRTAKADSLKKEFGRRFIVLPNAMYGDWEMALYDNNPKLSNQEKSEKRKSNLISF